MLQWSAWVAERSYLAAKLKGADPNSLEAYFLKIHAASEAFFRRMLFVGLRLNSVPFRDAEEWLLHNDSTPTRSEFPKIFDALYKPKMDFLSVVESCPRGQILWELWLDFAKPVRNHLAHGIRAYSSDWLECGVCINQWLLTELDAAMADKLGGSIADDLAKLRPRLPTGQKGVNIPALLGLKRGRAPRPLVSLTDAQSRLVSAGLLLSA